MFVYNNISSFCIFSLEVMPRRKSWRRSEARSLTWASWSVGDGGSGSGPDAGFANPLTDTSVSASGLVCLESDEGLTTPTGPPVPLVDLSTKPSDLQGCNVSVGDKARPTCLSHKVSDSQVRSWTKCSAVP